MLPATTFSAFSSELTKIAKTRQWQRAATGCTATTRARSRSARRRGSALAAAVP